jgi:hypothetical protein
MTFTLENTKEATHIYFNSTVGAIFRTDKGYIQGNMVSMSKSFDKIPYSAQVLSRSTKETKEYHTDFRGVTQYAQPQGNEMDDVSEIDWIHGSEYYKPSTKEFFRLPVTGNYAEYFSHERQAWKVQAMTPTNNLTRSYFVKRLEWPSCDSQENINPGVTLADSYSFKESLDSVIKPTFTQAQADAGEQAAIGSRVMYLAGTGIKKEDGTFTKGYWDETTIIARHNDMTWLDTHGIQSDIEIKPIQTAEEKLMTALWDTIEQNDGDLNESSIDAFRSDLLSKFTITLKG